MRFWEWPDILSVYRRAASPTSVSSDHRKFYEHVKMGILREIAAAQKNDEDFGRALVAYNQASVEAAFYDMGCPYYKLYPGAIALLMQSSLDIPSVHFRAPLSALLLRLPAGHGVAELCVEGAELKSILIEEAQPEDVVRVSDLANFGSPGDDKPTRRFVFWMDFGENTDEAGMSMPTFAFQVLGISDENVSLERHFEVWIGKDRLDWTLGLKIPDETVGAAIRLAVGACLLATSADRAVGFDVVNKWRDRYDRGSPEARADLERRSKKAGKLGWTIGREITLPSACSPAATGTVGAGRTLEHSHLRRGHFHIVKFGKLKKDARVAWYRPIVVKPDLPVAETRRGYKTPKS